MPYNIDKQTKISDTDPSAGSVNKSQVKDLKILIAEDDEGSQDLFAIVLEQLVKEIITAETGLDAVEKCRTNPDLDLILMDIRLPEMDGYEATRRIRQFNKDIIIIAQTAFGLTGDREKAIEAGCNDYISKPFTKEELFALVDKNLIKDRDNH